MDPDLTIGPWRTPKSPEAEASGELARWWRSGCPHRAPSTYPFPVVSFQLSAFSCRIVWSGLGLGWKLVIDGLFGYAAEAPWLVGVPPLAGYGLVAQLVRAHA